MQRTPGTLEIRFVVTDFQKEVPVVYNGVLADVPGGPAGGIDKTGAGTLVLGADNTAYSGVTTVASGGTLQVGAGAAAGSLGFTRGEIDAVNCRDSRLGSDDGHAFELRRFEFDDRARMGAVGLAGVLVDVERQFHARRAGRRPDCVIRLPGDSRVMVVDAKFPLEAFTALRDAGADEARQAAMTRVRADVAIADAPTALRRTSRRGGQ